jgi:hypothetical protein
MAGWADQGCKLVIVNSVNRVDIQNFGSVWF